MRNNAAKQATTDIFVFLDADTFFYAPEEVYVALRALPHYGMVQYQYVTLLSREESLDILDQPSDLPLAIPTTRKVAQYPPVGGLFAITRENFYKVNGFDELFCSWGSEDDAFGIVIQALIGPIFRIPYMLYHLYHPRLAGGAMGTNQTQANLDRWHKYDKASSYPDALRKLIFERDKRLNVVALARQYPPVCCAGAEWALHELLKSLQRRGHTVTAVIQGYPDQVFDGVSVYSAERAEEVITQADVVIGSHDSAEDAVVLARKHNKPFAAYIHNTLCGNLQALRSYGATIYANSSWVQRQASVDSVIYPIIDPDKVKVYNTGNCITLINLSENKGASLFWKLAQRLPQYQFLAVRGDYGDQVIMDELPSNVTLLDTIPDIREVYSRTHIVLMPSEYESWGRVAIEAGLSGIPTIAHPTPGLQEAMGDAGIFCDRSRIDAWDTQITSLMENDSVYAKASENSLSRANFLQSAYESQVDEFVARFR
jgi:glycosyltransferase involved in cell wall biosynthesis